MAYDHECHWENKFFISHDLLIAITSFTILVGFLAAIGNSLVLFSIYKRPSLRSTHIFFIGSLAVADLSVGLITMPVYASGALTWPFLLKNDYFEMVLDFLIFQTLSASSLSLCAVSYDRFLAITSPMIYTSFMTRKKIGWAITLIWIISVIIGCCSFVVTGYAIRPTIYLAVVFVSFLIPFVMIAYFYYGIFKVARHQARQISIQDHVSSTSGNSRSDEPSEERRNVKREHKAAITIAIVIGTFAVCWLPNLVIGVVHFAVSRYNHCEAEKTEQFWLITIPFALINSAINPTIYAARNEEFRKAFRQLLPF
jgi:hypothetical protein